MFAFACSIEVNRKRLQSISTKCALRCATVGFAGIACGVARDVPLASQGPQAKPKDATICGDPIIASDLIFALSFSSALLQLVKFCWITAKITVPMKHALPVLQTAHRLDPLARSHTLD